ncbi:uncharacterized protein [Apostichopus japonicus]|uniref:uncharacterized protein n=1 Tax=Stichopus japonicus TaxID=307972 RepID=UPI003AB3CB8E
MAQVPNQHGLPLNHQPGIMVQQQIPQHVGDLKGSGPRRTMGSLIIACGIAQIIISILIISFVSYGFYFGHWGLWNGVFAITAGSFGLASARKRSMVITFMVLAIIATLLCALCCGFQATYAAFNSRYYGGMTVLFIIICLSYGLQFLFCIIGASFTCSALSDGVTQQRVIVYPPYAMPPGQAYGASPYTGEVNMAMQPAPVNVGSVNDSGPPAYQFAAAEPKI